MKKLLSTLFLVLTLCTFAWGQSSPVVVEFTDGVSQAWPWKVTINCTQTNNADGTITLVCGNLTYYGDPADGKCVIYNAGNARWEVDDCPGAGTGAPTDEPYVTFTATGNLTADRVLTEAAGIDLSTAVAGQIRISANTTEIINNTWGAGEASNVVTYNVSGTTDPVWTISDGSVDLTAGTLKQGGTAVALSSPTFVTATAEGGLSGEINLGALTTGLLKITVAAGVATPSTATAGTDYQGVDATLTALAGLTITDVSVIQGTGTDAFSVLASGGNNYILGSNSDNTALEFKTPGNVLTQIGAQATDATLTALAGLTIADVSIIEGTGTDAVAMVASGGNNYILGSNSDNSALEFKTPGNVLTQIGGQATDGTLTALAGLTIADVTLITGTGTDAFEMVAASAANQILASNSDNTALAFTSEPTVAGITLTGANTAPDAAGELRYDSTITGIANGGLTWYKGTSVMLLVDLDTVPGDSEDDYVISYDKDTDKFYMKLDATTAGQAEDATLTALAGLTIADVSIIEGTGTDAFAMVASAGNNYILGSNSDNTALEFKTPGNVLSQIGAQATDGDLTAIAALTVAQGKIIIGSASPAWSLSAYALPIVDGTATYVLKTDGAGTVSWAADADTGGSTLLNNIGDPDGAGQIDMGDGEGLILSSAEDTGTVLTIKNIDADLAGATSLLDLAYNDDASAYGFFIRGYDNSYTDLKFSIGADGAATFGVVTASFTGALTGNADTATLAGTVTVVDSTDATSYILIADSDTGSLAVKTDAGLTYAADTGMLTATGFTGPLTGNASTSTLASTVTVVDSTDATSYIAMFDSDTGSLAIKTDAGLTYAADTGILTATGFAGPLTGAVTGNASTATLAATVTVVDSTDATSYVLIADSSTGSLAVKSDAGLTYASDTGILTATGFAGPLTGNVTGNASGTAATVTGAAQANITSLGVLTGLTVSGVIIPNAANTIALGSSDAEWSDIYLGDGAIIYGQNDNSNTITSSATDWIFAKDITVSGGNINFGNIAATIGDATTDTITFLTDGTGTGEIVFPNDSIGDAEIDWGSGAGQVDLDDIPDSATYQKVLADDVDAAGHVNRFYDSDGIGYITVTGLSVARVITFQDAAQTIANLGGIQTFSGAKTFSSPLILNYGETDSGTITIYEDSTNGSNFMTFKGPATLAGDTIVFQLPSDNGTNGYLLQTNGSGVTSWVDPAAGGFVTAVGDCASGDCLDGSSDGGTYISFYDAQGITRLQVGDAAGAVTLTLPITTSTLMGEGYAIGGLIFGDTYPPDAAGEIGYSTGVLAYFDGTASRTVMAELRASGGLIFGDSIPNTEGEIGYATDVLSYWGTSATRSVAALERAQTFTANNIFGDADTDTLTIRSMIIGGNSRAVQIAAALATPTYATTADDLYVAGVIETPGAVYGASFTSTASDGANRMSLSTNTTFDCATYPNSIYVLNNVFKVCESATSYDIPLPIDSVTWTGATHSFVGVTNLLIPTATPDANGEIAINNTNDTFLMYINSKLISLDFTGDVAGYVLKSDGVGGFTLQADATGGSPTLDTIAAPAADVTWTFDATEQLIVDFSGAYSTGTQFLVRQAGSDPTGGVLFEVNVADSQVTAARIGDGTNYTQFAQNGAVTLAGTALITAGGIVLGDSTPDASGEIGYATNAYTLFANSEDLSITAGSDLWTLASSTGATFAFTPTVTLSGGLTVATQSIPWVTGSGTASNTAEGSAYWETDTDMLTIGDGATGISLDFTANTAIVFPASSGTLQTTTGTPAGFIIASQAIGDTLYASSTTAWARLGIGAVGSFFMSNGAGQPPSYLAAGAANYVLVGAGVTTIPVWTAPTGTGSPVLADSPTFVDDITIATAGVKLTGSNGVITILGVGDGFDESLIIDLNSIDNRITLGGGGTAFIAIDGDLVIGNGAVSGGGVRLYEALGGGTNYSLIRGTDDAGTTPAFTFSGDATNESLTLTIGATDSNAATISSATGITMINFSGLDGTFSGGDIILGANTTTAGTIKLFGGTSGDITLQPTAVAGTTVLTLPATTGTLAKLENTLGDFAATTSAQLYGKISDETGSASGSPLLVFNQGPVLVAPALGAATATSLLATGIVDGTAPILITATTSGVTLGGTYKSGYTLVHPEAAAAASIINLPTAAEGLQYCVGNYAGHTGAITVNAVGGGQFIDLDGTLSADDGLVHSGGAAGDFACFVGISSTVWKAIPTKGTWALD